MLLETRQLNIRAGGRMLVEDLTLAVRGGEFMVILGRNGCGKSLTLHALAGLGKGSSGDIRLAGASLSELSRRQIARRLGLLPQDREEALALTAFESVLIGRHPHLPFWQRESAADLDIVRRALARLQLADCADRLLPSLSGGEQRRTGMAALLAQQPVIYLVDEPTNHLDPHHQIEILGLLRELSDAGAAVIAALHDPTLAARFADSALLLYGDGRWRAGPAASALNAADLSALYLTPIAEIEILGRRAFCVC